MSKAAGKKRASPGAAEEKGVDIEDAQYKQLEDAQKERDRVELYLNLHNLRYLQPTYTKQRQVFKSIPKFWPTALYHHQMLAYCAEHAADKDALSFLEDVWINRSEADPRVHQIEFHFKENPYFSNAVLVKDYKYIPPPVASDSAEDEYGLTAAQKDFEEDRDIKPQSFKIDWKSDSKNLVAQYPRKMEPEGEDEAVDSGSFFNWFTDPGDELQIGSHVSEVFEDAVKFFLNQVDDDDDDITDSEEEDEEAGDEEIDLEQPKKKARKA